MAKRRINGWKPFWWTFGSAFVLVNAMAAMQAWRFTHFTGSNKKCPQDAGKIPLQEKLKMAFTGTDNPRPENSRLPNRPFKTVQLQSHELLNCWALETAQPCKGTVILFHGYGGDKSLMLDKAYILLDAGYNVFLPDFMGAGTSSGNQTTIGFKEADDVKVCADYIRQAGEKNLFLFGTSMGAAAVLHYINEGNTQPKGIIIECPFGTMYETVSNRFKMVGFPSFPLAGMLVFWGGAENGFWAFNHNPETYAETVICPTLLLYGAKDDRVTRAETDAIYAHLSGPKKLKIYPKAGHENYLVKHRQDWTNDVTTFLGNIH